MGVVFRGFFVIPSDFPVPGSREKFYGLRYILPLAIQFSFLALPVPDFSGFLSTSFFSQILSVVLFLSLIPILIAKKDLLNQKFERSA